MKKKKHKVRILGDRCLLCRRKATQGMACEKHKYNKVDLKYFSAPFVIVDQVKKARLKQKTLYPCARCKYQLLSWREVEIHLSTSVSRAVRTLAPTYICKNPGDCARRMADLVAGKHRVYGDPSSLTL